MISRLCDGTEAPWYVDSVNVFFYFLYFLFFLVLLSIPLQIIEHSLPLPFVRCVTFRIAVDNVGSMPYFKCGISSRKRLILRTRNFYFSPLWRHLFTFTWCSLKISWLHILSVVLCLVSPSTDPFDWSGLCMVRSLRRVLIQWIKKTLTFLLPDHFGPRSLVVIELMMCLYELWATSHATSHSVVGLSIFQRGTATVQHETSALNFDCSLPFLVSNNFLSSFNTYSDALYFFCSLVRCVHRDWWQRLWGESPLVWISLIARRLVRNVHKLSTSLHFSFRPFELVAPSLLKNIACLSKIYRH